MENQKKYSLLTTHFPSIEHCLMESPLLSHSYSPNVHFQDSDESPLGAATAVAVRARRTVRNCILSGDGESNT